MPQYALIIQYNGADFAGFARQKNVISVQEMLEQSLSKIFREECTVVCAGRTDAGVHASGQVVMFSLSKSPPEERRVLLSLNALLPESIAAEKFTQVPGDFHPRFSCLAREYEYLIWNSPVRSVFWHGRSLWHRGILDVDIINKQLGEILGERDFASFTRHEYRDESTVRYVDTAHLSRATDTVTGSGCLVSFRIRGNAFLHNMIRILTGTILDISRGKMKRTLLEILDLKLRSTAGPTVPPHGLYLRRAYYPEHLASTGLATLENYPVFRKYLYQAGDQQAAT